MSHPLMQVLTSRWLALAAVLAMAALGLALIITSVTATRTETELRRRIADLMQENRQTGAVWGARLAACETRQGQSHGRVTAAALSNEERAKALAQTAPTGFDVCARMESADRAVLETLK